MESVSVLSTELFVNCGLSVLLARNTSLNADLDIFLCGDVRRLGNTFFFFFFVE